MALLLIAFADHNRQLVRPFIDLPVGQRYPLKYQRHIIRCGCRTRLELLLQGFVLRVRHVGLVPAVQQGMAFLCGQHVKSDQRLLLIGDKRCQHPLIDIGHPRYRGLVKQAHRVIYAAGNTACAFCHKQAQVKLGGAM